MKKLLLIFISLLMLIGVLTTAFAAENDTHIDGLDICLDKIYLNSDINKEVREKILETNEVYLQERVNDIMGYPNYAKMKMGLKLGDDEYIEEQIREGYALNTDKGLLISDINTNKYLMQYSEENSISYLLSENNVFKVRRNKNEYGTAFFSAEGQAINDAEMLTKYVGIADDNIFSYISSRQLRDDIAAKGETEVQDIKIFGLGYLTVLYIKCASNEYLVKLYDNNDNILPNIKSYVLYKANELLSAFNDAEIKSSVYSQDLAMSVLATKPTYATEAESLQADGLLKGNEKGLDLLKPLTRIEATAILVRAMGYEDAQTSDTSYFTDIQSDNWGAKYANIAKDKGIASGVGDSMFAPNDTITASQFATLILRNMGENPDWQTAIDTFVERGLITSEQAEKMDLFTRGDMAKIIYEAKQRSMF